MAWALFKNWKTSRFIDVFTKLRVLEQEDRPRKLQCRSFANWLKQNDLYVEYIEQFSKHCIVNFQLFEKRINNNHVLAQICNVI